MTEMNEIFAALVFVIIWYGLILIGRALFKPYEKMKLVWCSEVRSFSFIETDTVSKGDSVVKHCLLWPEYGGCKQRCVKQP
jgi:hypothetical protein